MPHSLSLEFYLVGEAQMLRQLPHAFRSPEKESIVTSFLALFPAVTVCFKLSIRELTSSASATALLAVAFDYKSETIGPGIDRKLSWAENSTRDWLGIDWGLLWVGTRSQGTLSKGPTLFLVCKRPRCFSLLVVTRQRSHPIN